MARPIITLTTDFGTDSPYVGQMKASILSVNAEVTVVDITHSVSPQNIQLGALILEDVIFQFPPSTIHVAVVDPGVGTSRNILVWNFESQLVIAPDNGLISGISQNRRPKVTVSVSNRRYWNTEISPTFHGRDVIAPVAAHLSLGTDLLDMGDLVTTFVEIPWTTVRITPHSIDGCVVMNDSFGNLITNIGEGMLEAVNTLDCRIRCGSHEIVGIATTYGDQPPTNLIALVGSSGRLELAVVNGDAEQMTGAQVGDQVSLSWS